MSDDFTSDFTRFTPAVGRLLMVVLFFYAGIGKLAAPAATKTYIATGLPYPDVAYWLAVAVEIGVAALFLLGFQTRVMAAVLALFSVATALAFHHNLGDQTQMLNFLKNLAIAGGFLQAVGFGGGACSVDAALSGSR
jgi:putative oxidoreductase